MADSNHKIINADCMDAMADMGDNSVHAVVTDPPYGLAFMGRTWDDFEPKEYQEWCEEWASEALRVLKPGGHLIAFSGNRTHHRLMTGVEDAGFTVRDTITYHYGVGFPKGSDIGKHIDRYYDAEDEREVVGTAEFYDGSERKVMDPSETANQYGGSREGGGYDITAPATSEAEQWDGWRTQLKPSTEFAVLARAPMSESAVYRNVLEHGCGALNIDRTRIPTEDNVDLTGGGAMTPTQNEGYTRPWMEDEEHRQRKVEESRARQKKAEENGRYPANLLLDGVAARMLDGQSGHLEPGGQDHQARAADDGNSYGNGRTEGTTSFSDSGGASRFFYTAKSSKSERTIDGQVDNEHPTVKPLDLMEYLVTLVTAPGQTVLDPFAGSGTTIMACRRLNREGIGVEQDEGHADLARKRVDLAHELETEWDNSPGETTDEPGEDNRSNEEGQQGLDVFTDGGESDQSK